MMMVAAMMITETAPTMMAVPIMTIKATLPLRLRHELNHTINAADDLILSRRLRQLFPHDNNADSHGSYRVSSLYFDDLFDHALREKINGVNRREKFRLRYYGSDLSFIRLEKKFKINGLCGKRSARITQEQVERLLQGKITFLLQSEDPLLQELYSKIKGQGLVPKTIVTYDREAFLYSPVNVRLTLDRIFTAACALWISLLPGAVMHRYPKARLFWGSNMMTSCRIWFAWRFR